MEYFSVLLAALRVSITPWTAMNNAFAMRSWRLTMIDGSYATIACTIIGVVLTLK